MASNTFFQRFARNRPAVSGALFLVFVVVLSVVAPLLFPEGPFTVVGQPFSRPFETWVLGTDSLGRDVAAGLAYGGRTSIGIGVIATLFAVAVGTAVGAAAGFYGGLVDSVIMRVTEFFQTIPAFLFAIVLVALMSPSRMSVVIAIAVVSWPPVARLVRGEYMRLANAEFVQAAACLGMGDLAIMARQILPNALSPIVVTGSLMVATAILTEAALSFLGLGDPNSMSWGFMIGSGRSFLRDAWWLCAIPGFAILLTVLCINLVGEGVNDALNPRLRLAA
jgi:peptide/nickel transport system permease protein